MVRALDRDGVSSVALLALTPGAHVPALCNQAFQDEPAFRVGARALEVPHERCVENDGVTLEWPPFLIFHRPRQGRGTSQPETPLVAKGIGRGIAASTGHETRVGLWQGG